MASRTAHIVAKFDAKTQQYTAAIKIAANATKDLAKETEKTSEVMSKSASSWKKATVAVTGFYLTIRKLLKVLTEFSDAGSRAQEIQQKFDIVFRDNRAEAQAWANDLADAYNRSSTEVEKFAAQLQNTFVPLGFAREEATKLSKRMVELSMDLSSFNDIPMARVVTDIQSALMGNVRAVRKYGVSANETRIFQEALTSGLIKQKHELDAVSKAQAINNIILEATKDAHGDLERTMHQTANVTRAYNETLTRSKEITGDYINIVLTPLKKVITEIMEAWNDAREAHNAYLGAFIGGDSALAVAESEKRIELLKEELKLAQTSFNFSTEFTFQKIQRIQSEIAYEEDRLKLLRDLIHEEQKRINNANELEKLDKDQLQLDATRLKIFTDFEEQLRVNNELEAIAIEKGTEYNKLRDDANAVQNVYNALLTSGLTHESELVRLVIDNWGDLIVLREDYLDQLEKEKELKKELEQKEKDRIEFLAKLEKIRVEDMAQRAIEAREIRKDAIEEELKQAEKVAQAWKDMYMSIPSMVAGVFSSIASIVQAHSSREIQILNFRAETEKETRERLHEEERLRLEEDIADKYDRNEAIKALDEEFAESEKEIANDLELEKREMMYKSSMIAWRLQLLNAQGLGAQAVLNAMATVPYPAVIAAAILAGLNSTIQTGIIWASKPVKNFQTGTENFTVPEGFSNDSFGIGLSSGENVTVRTPTEQSSEGNVDATIEVALVLNDTEMGRYVGKLSKNRKLRLHLSDIIND